VCKFCALIFLAVAEKTAKDGSGMLYFATPCSIDKHINLSLSFVQTPVYI